MTTLRCVPEGAPSTVVHIGVDVANLAELATRPGAFLLADARVLAAHGDRLPFGAGSLALEAGEAVKTFAMLERVLSRMARLGLGRRACLVALGGGSIGDLAGLAAGLFLRGIEFVQVPTTLVAMLDSSVGGKTAINLPEGKNLVGMIWPAGEVRIDVRFLGSLPPSELASGLGEAIKVAIGLDAELFALMEGRREAISTGEPRVMEEVIELAVRAKIRIVEQDPFEAGPRRLLNLGHTLGHALEAHSGWRIPHGVAVARGLHFALDVARQRGTIEAAEARRCRDLLIGYGFAATELPPAPELRPFFARDKKVEDGALHFVLPTAVGASRTERIAVDDLC